VRKVTTFRLLLIEKFKNWNFSSSFMDKKKEDELVRYIEKHRQMPTPDVTIWARERFGDISEKDVWTVRRGHNLLTLEEKVELKKGRRAFMHRIAAGGVALGICGGLYALFSPEPQSEFRYDPTKGIIYLGKPNIDSAKTHAKIRDMLWADFQKDEKYRDVQQFLFRHSRAQDFARPLQRDVDIGILEEILVLTEEELNNLGWDQNYEVIPVYHADDISEDTSKIFAVADLGREMYANMTLVFPTRTESFIFNGEQPLHGEADKKGEFLNGRITVAPGNIYLMVQKTKLGIASSVMNEILHNQMTIISERVTQEILRFEKKGKTYQFLNMDEAQLSALYADESIVHGITLHWLNENKRRLGVTDDEMRAEIEKVGARKLYLGAPTIMRIADEQGRPALVHDCIANPMKYWNILRERVPEYRKIK